MKNWFTTILCCELTLLCSYLVWVTLGFGTSGPIVFKMKSEHKNIANYVNHAMSELNELSTELYEAMMDQENAEVKKIVDKMIPILKDIQSTHTNEII